MRDRQIIYSDLGILGYREAWDLQERALQKTLQIKSLQRQSSDPSSIHTATSNQLFFVEHPPVFTLGKSGDDKNLLIDEAELSDRSIEYYHTNRGGDITFHGPGQIVCYPIFDLENFFTDIGKYLRNLEEVIILTMQDYGLVGQRSPGETGVWMDVGVAGKARKICAIGVRCSRWVTMHGFAFNVNTDLSYFNHIIPCGISDKQVTSLEKELGETVSLDQVKKKIVANFGIVFDAVMRPEPASAAMLVRSLSE